jgi:predicted nucleotidyltransferase
MGPEEKERKTSGATPLGDLPPLVQRTIQRLAAAFSPERILLFGSYAKNTSDESSDIDLLVVADLYGNPLLHQRRARHLSADCFPPVDIVLVTPEDVANAARAKSPFLLSILGTSTTVYSRPRPVSGTHSVRDSN